MAVELESQLSNIFKDVLRTDVIVEVFTGFVSLSPNEHEKRLTGCMRQFRSLFATLTSDNHIPSIKILVKLLHNESNIRRVNFMFDFLEACIKDGFLPPKFVLDNLQCSDLSFTKKVHWCRTYLLIRKFVYLIDYKGCRNILNSMLLKLREIPPSSWSLAKQQVDAICHSIELLLDPEACLLPGYLAVNEIRQNMPEEQLIAPWPLLSKLTMFVDRFRAVSNMVSTTGRWMLLPVVNNTSYQLASTWKLEPETLRFPLKRQLPYSKEMYQRQWRLLRYILGQANSRDMVLQVLGLQKNQKQRCSALETELVELMVNAMKHSDIGSSTDDEQRVKHPSQLLWLHLPGQVIFFVLYQLASFPHMVEALHARLSSNGGKTATECFRGRNRLMWVLLQFISGSIQKNPLSDFLPVVKLIRLLYPEKQPLPLPDMSKPSSIICFSAICILTHMNRKSQAKAQAENQGDTANSAGSEPDQQWVIPIALQTQHQFLKQCLQKSNTTLQDYRIALVCNACRTTAELFNNPIKLLVDSVCGDPKSTFPMPGTNCTASNTVIPLSMDLLDSLTAHTKMSMLVQIGTAIQKVAQSQSTIALSPSLVETYSRLLVYTEIESLGTKVLVNQILPKVAFELRSWHVLYTLLEIISYRMHHTQTVYRISLLNILHNLATSSNANQRQLHLRIESTALRLIMGFDNFDISPQLLRLLKDQKHIVSNRSEELNRVLVLTLARSIRITGAETISGSWCTDILHAIMQATPHRWPQHTLAGFPRSMQEYFQQQQVLGVDKMQLRETVADEYTKWGSLLAATPVGEMSSNLTENDILVHFSSTGNSHFVCVLWKVLFDGKSLSALACKVLEHIGASQLAAHVRTFSDFLVSEFSVGDGGDHVKVCADLLRDMVWKYNIVFLDRLILCLALRSSEAKDVQVAFFIIQYLLIKPEDFRIRVHHFTQEVDSTDHWCQNDWHPKHMAYHQKFPEMHYFEGMRKHCSGAEQLANVGDNTSSQHYLPTYFGNITLRFLPVLDLVIHRCLELPAQKKSLELLLDHIGPLYKFHDHPITYLFNTLHYYEDKLRNQPQLKKKLVATIIGPVSDSKPSDWALSQDYVTCYLHSVDSQRQPSRNYYCKLVKRLVDSISSKNPPPFTPRDWRFNEFPNACAHALQVTCVEALALPISGEIVGQAIMDVVLKSQPMVEKEDILSWMNATALILTSLPEIYWQPLHQNIQSMICCETLTADIEPGSSYPYHILTYSNQQLSYSDLPCTRLLALTHIAWHHMSIGQLSLVSQFLKEDIRPIVKTELQMLYVFHLIGPYIPRYQQERTRCMMDVARLLYDILLGVSRHTTKIHFADEIADFLYHVKYMHTGTAIDEKVKEVLGQVDPALRKRLQFITHSQTSARTQQTSFPASAPSGVSSS